MLQAQILSIVYFCTALLALAQARLAALIFAASQSANIPGVSLITWSTHAPSFR